MLLKFKNKYLMSLDKLIKEGENIGGFIESIVLDPKEGMGLLLELIKLGQKYTTNIEILDNDGVNITRQELIWNGGIDKTDHIKKLVQQWYKIQITITYKKIPLCVVKPKLGITESNKIQDGWVENSKQQKEEFTTDTGEKTKKEPEDIPEFKSIINSWKVYDDPPKPPKGPLNRMIAQDGVCGICDKCGSSWKSKWFGFRRGDGCIHPECENYWDKK